MLGVSSLLLRGLEVYVLSLFCLCFFDFVGQGRGLNMMRKRRRMGEMMFLVHDTESDTRFLLVDYLV